MGLKATIAKIWANKVAKKTIYWHNNAVELQAQWQNKLVKAAQNTAFGKDHNFNNISTYAEFKSQVPIADYEALKPYIERVKLGEANVLWTGKPIYFAKTSGTTSGSKYIPISKESIHNHISTARNALLMLIHHTGEADFIERKLIFLSGSPVLDTISGIFSGRLSGIVNHHIPQYLRKNQMPSYATNCIDDWEEKVAAVVQETHNQDMALISGIPPWMQMYFDSLQAFTGKTIPELFPNFKVLVYGGVNFEPYRAKLMSTIGLPVHTIETYPASEGFIAFQDSRTEPGLLLNVDSGIFFEFIPTADYFNENPTRLWLKDVEIGVNYAIVLNTNAGLWGYSIGDTVKFVSLNPYRIVVTGRIKHFISAFGEHVIGEEVDHAMKMAAEKLNISVTEFHVAPQVTPPEGGLPYHEWYIEAELSATEADALANEIDAQLCHKNTYYNDLIVGKILQRLKLNVLPPGAFIQYMKNEGKLGGQNKLPRLANDRIIADKLGDL